MTRLTAYMLGPLALALWFVWKVVRDLKTGTVPVVGGHVRRSENPGRFYTNVAFEFVAIALFAYLPIWVGTSYFFSE